MNIKYLMRKKRKDGDSYIFMNIKYLMGTGKVPQNTTRDPYLGYTS